VTTHSETAPPTPNEIAAPNLSGKGAGEERANRRGTRKHLRAEPHRSAAQAVGRRKLNGCVRDRTRRDVAESDAEQAGQRHWHRVNRDQGDLDHPEDALLRSARRVARTGQRGRQWARRQVT
jgi:hypothetical protein